MDRLKVMTIVGTRPEIIRLSATIQVLDCSFDHILVHTGQNYDYALNEVFFADLGLRAPDHHLEVAGSHLGQTMGHIIERSYALMAQLRPDALLVLGDTNSALSVISAKRLKIPVFHMEAGNRCFDENVPEEINRRIVDHISDINLPYTQHARRYLLAEGIAGDRVYVTGSPMGEVLHSMRARIGQSDVLARLNLTRGQYFVLSAHREENVDITKNFESLLHAVNTVAERYAMPVVFSVHPRTRKRLEQLNVRLHPGIRLSEPFGFSDYIHLQQHALCVLSDSGTLSEESAILGFAAVLLRTSTERPEALETGHIVIGNIGARHLLQSIGLAVQLRQQGGPLSIPPDYAVTDVSRTIVRLIQSYVPIINERVWRK